MGMRCLEAARKRLLALAGVMLLVLGMLVCGASPAFAEDWYTPTSWDDLEAAIEGLGAGETLNVKLESDIVCDNPTDTTNHIVVANGTVTVDLAGNTLSRGLTDQVDNGCVFYVQSSLTVTDSVGGGVITGARNYSGAVFVDENASFTMTGGAISGNTNYYGGAIYAKGSVTLGEGVVIEDNQTSGGYGGGVYFIPSSSDVVLEVDGAIFRNNTSSYGGAIFAKGTTVVGGNALFEGNKATSDNGGAIRFDGNSGSFSLTVTDATFTGNTTSVSYGGGAIYGYQGDVTIGEGVLIENNEGGYGGGIRYSGYRGTTLTVSGAVIQNNNSRYGGGLYTSGNVVINGGTVIDGNLADGEYGGGLFYYSGDISGTSLTISNATISNNTADYGGGIYGIGDITVGEETVIDGNKAITDYGGGIYLGSGSLALSGATISNNTAEACGGGVMIWRNSDVTIEDSTITGNVVNRADDNFYGGGGVHLHAEGNSWSGWVGTHAVTLAGANDISGNTAGGNPSNLWVGNDYYRWDNARSNWLVATDGALSNVEPIGITTDQQYNTSTDEYEYQPYVFTTGYAANNTKDPWAYFTSNVPELIVLWNEDETEAMLGYGWILSYDANAEDAEGEVLEGHYPRDDEDKATGKVSEDEFTREGYTFDGWNTKADGSGTDYAAGDSVELTEDVTLYAQWKPVPHTVTFETNGGSAVGSQTVYHGLTATEPAKPGKDGHTFVGWFSDEGLTQEFDFSTEITADTTLYAKWEANTYDVTFEANGGSEVESQTVKYGETATEPEKPSKEGCTFVGWFSDEGLTQEFDFSTQIKGDITLYAKWDINTYDVTFEANGGSEVESQTVKYGETATEPEKPSKEGCTFAGWYSDEGLTEEFDFSTQIKGDITLYAKWVPETETEVVPGEGAPEIDSDNLGDVADDEFTDDEREQGTRLWLEVNVIDEANVPAEDKTLLETLANDLGAEPGMWLDITLWRQVGDNEPEQVHATATPVNISITVPDSLTSSGRTYYMLRAHDGAASTVAQGTDIVLTWETDGFSTYLLAYKDSVEPKPDDEETPTPTDDVTPTPDSGSKPDSGSAPDSAQKPAATVPSTGDNTSFGVVAIIAVLGCALVIAGFIIRRRGRG